MKNLFLILFLILGIGITYAGKNYKVTVTYEIIYEYYDDSNGSYMGEKPAGTSSNKFSFYAETPHEAEEKAISQCSSTFNNDILVHCYHNIIVFIMRLIHQHNGIDRLEKNDQR